MSSLTIGCIGLVLMCVLMFLGMNVGLSFMLTGFVGMSMMMGISGGLTYLESIPLNQTLSYTYCVLPLFLLMGNLSVAGRLTTDAYKTARNFLGRLPGGLAITSAVASAIFGAICGSGQATAMIMTEVAWPEMKRYNYKDKLGLCSIAAAGPLAILIPPSTAFITYGVLSGCSIGALFMAGWGPGILMCLGICATVVITVLLHPDWAPRAAKTSWEEKFQSLAGAAPILLLIVLMMICIWGGITTVNEAAGVSVLACLLIVVLKRRCTTKQILQTIKNSATGAASLFFLFVGIGLFNTFLSLTRLPAVVSSWLVGLNMSPYGIIWGIVILYAFLGCFLEGPVIVMLTTGLLIPTVEALGFDLVWFGVISTMCVALGAITPPVGINLFVINSRVPEIPLATLYKGIWPYVFACVLSIVLVMYIPEIALWLPNMMMK